MDPWNRIAHLSREQIRTLQNKKLADFINHQLYPFSPYYRKLFDEHRINPRQIKTLEDLRQIPLTSKTDFLPSPENPEKFKDFVLQPDNLKIRQFWPALRLLRLALASGVRGSEFVRRQITHEYRPVFATFTTGTTNTPVSFLYSPYDIKNLYTSGARMLNLFNISNSERVVNIFPFAPHLAFWQVVFGGLSSDLLILSTGGGKVMTTEGNITAILKMRPSVILGVPSYVYHLLRVAEGKGCRMEFVKRVVLGAAAVSEPFKQKLRSLLDLMGAKEVAIFGTYGFTEARSAWAECPSKPGTSSGYHLYPDKEIFEVIDSKTGEVKKEGEEGELVYTALDSRGSALLRYRTGDFVKGGITCEPCPYCGKTVGRIASEITRISDIQGLQLSKIKGSLVDLSHFAAVLNNFPSIVEWQMEIRKKDNDPHEVDELLVYVCATDSVDQNQLKEDLKKSIASATEVTPNQIIFTSLPELVKRLELETASKEKRILDLRPKPPP